MKNNKKDIDGVWIFSRFLSWFMGLSATAMVVVSISIIAYAMIFLYAIYTFISPPNVLKYMEQTYGEKFEIVENYGKEDSNRIGLYLLSPKANKNIQFKLYNQIATASNNDFQDRQMKYYFENCKDKNLTDDFVTEENYKSYKNIDNFMIYGIYLEMNNYDEIEEKVEKMYNLKQYFLNCNSKMTGAIILENKNINYSFMVEFNNNDTVYDEMVRAKCDYIQKLKEKGLKNELEKISEHEILEVWKPEKLTMYINEEPINFNNQNIEVYYNAVNQEYYTIHVDAILHKIREIEIIKVKYGNIQKFKYNNVLYKVVEEPTSKENEIYINATLEDLFKIFNGKIRYDYANKSVYVTI